MAAQASFHAPPLELVVAPEDSARAAGLRYIADDRPGITRKRSGKSFSYIDPTGRRVGDRDTLGRIRSLAIPPAWERVWISPFANGHVQATGRDEKGRKQYRYHPRWRETRDETKYHRMIAFADALPRIRARIAADLGRPELPREKVLATIVRLLETTLIRVGNEEYARKNRSFGLTTLRNRHVQVTGATIAFHFRGKSGKHHEIDLRDRRLASIVRKMAELPGHELFQYLNERGESHTVESGDVNEYLREVSGEPFTAKDFRTWGGTVLAAIALRELEGPVVAPDADAVLKKRSRAQARKQILLAIKSVSQRLGNTPSVCRKCYVHPAILDGYLDGQLIEMLPEKEETAVAGSLALRAEETAVVSFLRDRAASDAEPLEAKLNRGS